MLGQVVAKGGIFRYVVFGLCCAAAEGNQQKKSEKSCDLVCHMCVTSENSENIAKKLVEIPETYFYYNIFYRAMQGDFFFSVIRCISTSFFAIFSLFSEVTHI